MGIKLSNKIKNQKLDMEIKETDIFEDSTEEESFEEVLNETINEIVPKVKSTTPSIKKTVTGVIDDLQNHKVKHDDVVDQTDKIIEKVHQSAVMHTVKNNDGVQKKVLASAEEQVLSSIDIKRSTQQLKVVQASYNANKDACENLGLSDEGRPMWQIRVARVINNFWFIIWAIISTFTLTPIIFFLKRIGTQVKSAKLTWVLSGVFYLGVLFILFLIIATIWNNAGSAPEWIRWVLGGSE